MNDCYFRTWNLIFPFVWIQSREEKSKPPSFSVSYPRVKCHRFFQANGSTTLLSAKCITFRGRFNAEFLSRCKVFNRLRWEIRFREFYRPERIDSSPLLLGTAYIKPQLDQLHFSPNIYDGINHIQCFQTRIRVSGPGRFFDRLF